MITTLSITQKRISLIIAKKTLISAIISCLLLCSSACISTTHRASTNVKNATTEVTATGALKTAALAKLNSGDIAGSISAHLEALEHAPDDYLLHYRLGLSRQLLGQLPEAEQAYSRSLTLKPSFFAYQARARTRIFLNKHREALLDLEQTLKLLTESPSSEFYSLKAFASLGIGDDRAVIENATLALMEDPKNLDAYRLRGDLYARHKLYADAINDYSAIISAEPGDAITFINRGAAHLEMGTIDIGIQDLRAAVKLAPNVADYAFRLGRALKNSQNHQEAITYFSKAVALDPSSAVYIAARGYCFGVINNYKRALEDFDASIRLEESTPSGKWHHMRGKVKSVIRDYSGALEDYSLAIELGLTSPELYYDRSFIHRELGSPSKAIKDLDQAVRMNPKQPFYYDRRGCFYSELHNFEEALLNHTLAIKINPRIASFYNNRGYSRLQKGDIDGAIHDFDRCIEIDNLFGLAYINRGNAKIKKDDHIGGALDQARGSTRPPNGKETPRRIFAESVF
jgi:tetratricopeptide (TPR) repeat protein